MFGDLNYSPDVMHYSRPDTGTLSLLLLLLLFSLKQTRATSSAYMLKCVCVCVNMVNMSCLTALNAPRPKHLASRWDCRLPRSYLLCLLTSSETQI